MSSPLRAVIRSTLPPKVPVTQADAENAPGSTRPRVAHVSPTLRAPAPPSGTRQPEAAGAPQKTCAGSAGTLQSELEKVRRNGAPAPARPPPDGGQLAFGPGLRLRGPPPQTVISGQLRKGRAEWPTGPTAGRRPVSSWAPAGLVSQRHGLCDTVRLRPAARGGRAGLPPAAPAGTRRCAPLSFGYQASVLNSVSLVHSQ